MGVSALRTMHRARDDPEQKNKGWRGGTLAGMFAGIILVSCLLCYLLFTWLPSHPDGIPTEHLGHGSHFGESFNTEQKHDPRSRQLGVNNDVDGSDSVEVRHPLINP